VRAGDGRVGHGHHAREALQTIAQLRCALGEHRDVADLAAEPRLLAVEVQARAGDRQHRFGGRRRADQVHHRDRAVRRRAAEREAGDRAQVVLELARLRALDRPVPAVVHARRHLVRDQRVADLERLERQHADVAQRLHQPRHRDRRLRFERGVQLRGRRDGGDQDAADVVVLDERPAADLALGAAHREHRELARERHELLEDERPAAQAHPGLVDIARRMEHELPLAVVAEAARLQHRRTAELRDAALQLLARVHRDEVRHRDPVRAEE